MLSKMLKQDLILFITQMLPGYYHFPRNYPWLGFSRLPTYATYVVGKCVYGGMIVADILQADPTRI